MYALKLITLIISFSCHYWFYSIKNIITQQCSSVCIKTINHQEICMQWEKSIVIKVTLLHNKKKVLTYNTFMYEAKYMCLCLVTLLCL